MKNNAWMSVTTLVVLLLAGTTDALAAKPGGTTACPIAPDTDFAVYGQTFKGGVGTSSRSWMAHFFDWWKAQDPSVDYLFLTAAQAQACTNLKATYPNLKMWVQPGGNAYDQQTALGAAGKANINGFIVNQGALPRRLRRRVLRDSRLLVGRQVLRPPEPARRLPGHDGRRDQQHRAVARLRDDGPQQRPERDLLRRPDDRPAAHEPGEPARRRRQASFASIGGSLPAVIVYNNLLLTSVHLEAFENDGISGLSTADRTENYKYLANLINRVARTTLQGPGLRRRPARSAATASTTTATAQWTCPADPGCSSALDDDETDAPAGQVIADGFENGLGAWTVTGTGAPWTASSLDPYTGSRHAYAVQPGVSTMTYLERTFSLAAFTKAATSSITAS